MKFSRAAVTALLGKAIRAVRTNTRGEKPLTSSLRVDRSRSYFAKMREKCLLLAQYSQHHRNLR
jgi:hypothetical protein